MPFFIKSAPSLNWWLFAFPFMSFPLSFCQNTISCLVYFGVVLVRWVSSLRFGLWHVLGFPRKAEFPETTLIDWVLISLPKSGFNKDINVDFRYSWINLYNPGSIHPYSELVFCPYSQSHFIFSILLIPCWTKWLVGIWAKKIVCRLELVKLWLDPSLPICRLPV